MSFIAERLNRISPSPTLEMTAKAAALRAAGKDIISLSAGEPDFDTPDSIKEAAKQAIAEGVTKYTAVAGMPALKEAIQDKLKRDSDLSFEQNQIVVSSGAKQAIFNAWMATVDIDDEVIIPAPYWVSYPDIVQLCGGTPKVISCSEATGFKLTASQLEAAITPQTKWLLLNSPSNPTGAVYTESELAALAQVLMRHPQVWILSDDIYEHLVYDDFKFISIGQIEPALTSRLLIVNGVSKAYAMTGWRIGYAAGPVELIKAMTKLQSQSTSNACSISQAAAIQALKGSHSFLDPWRAAFVERRDCLMQHLSEIPELTCIRPHGAFYLYAGCAGVIGQTTPDGKQIQTDTDFCTYLLEHAGVATVSGTAFGLSPYFRLSYATSLKLLDQAGQRIKEATANL